MVTDTGHRSTLAGFGEPSFVSMAWPRLRHRAVRDARRAVEDGLAGAASATLDGVAEAHRHTRDPALLRALVEATLDPREPSEERCFAAYRIGYLARAAAGDPGISDDEVADLFGRALRWGAEMRGGGGLAETAAGVALAGYLRDLSGLDLDTAVSRFRSAVEDQLTAESVHRSGSPGAHIEVLNGVAAVLAAGLTDDRHLMQIRLAMEEALAWMVAPDGSLVEVGDTRPRLIGGLWAGYDMEPTAMEAVYQHPNLLHAATAGALGMAPPQGWRVFPEAGIAISKTGWPEAIDRLDGSSLLLVQGDSGRREQADDLNVVWFDRGRWLLVGPGSVRRPDQAVRPDQRIRSEAEAGEQLEAEDAPAPPPIAEIEAFVKTRAAHNVVDIEDDIETTAASEVVRWGTIRGTQVLEAETVIGGVAQHRSVALVPGAWLVVVDTLTIGGAPTRRRRFRQPEGPPAAVWFHAATGLDVAPGTAGLVLAAAGDPVAWVTQLGRGWDPIPPERGRRHQPLQGWGFGASGRPVALWGFGWRGTTPRRSVVLFTLDGPASVEASDAASCTWSTAGERVRLSWSETGILDLERGPEARR
ncbi:MAG: hypothetical protein KJ698_10505 [Actinobacteria bacterium]|nr:hypothetical protein [Actinomycetota bacterium]MBU1493020.1 hypothetical protein [Actinomycetota bacterium]